MYSSEVGKNVASLTCLSECEQLFFILHAIFCVYIIIWSENIKSLGVSLPRVKAGVTDEWELECVAVRESSVALNLCMQNLFIILGDKRVTVWGSMQISIFV